MDRIIIHAVFNNAEKSAEFITNYLLGDSLGDKASQFTWLRPFKDKKGNYPSKWILDGLTWDDLQALKQFSKDTGSGSDHSIRIRTGKSHLDVYWSGDYIYEDCSYWVHATGPLHWKSIDILGKVLDRYIRGCRLLEYRPGNDTLNIHLQAYMNAYRDVPNTFEVENALWDPDHRLDLFSTFNSPGIYSTCHITTSNWRLQVDVFPTRVLKITAHRRGTPREHTEQLAEIPYEGHWEKTLKEEFFKAVDGYISE